MLMIWTSISSIAILTRTDNLSSFKDFCMFSDLTASSRFPSRVNSNTDESSCSLIRKNPEYALLLLRAMILEYMKINNKVANSETTRDAQNPSAPHK